MPAHGGFDEARIEEWRQRIGEPEPTAVPRSGTSPGCEGSHFQDALWRLESDHVVAQCDLPRRVSVITSSHTRRPNLMPTPAKPIPAPRVLVLVARSW